MTEPTYLDSERARNLIELAIRTHPEKDRVYRFLRCGAGFVARRVGDQVEFALAFTDSAQHLARVRAEVWDAEPDEPTEQELNERIELVKTPADVIEPKPQG
jgi:hypothetical protein